MYYSINLQKYVSFNEFITISSIIRLSYVQPDPVYYFFFFFCSCVTYKIQPEFFCNNNFSNLRKKKRIFLCVQTTRKKKIINSN
jgi:hypothetical protein